MKCSPPFRLLFRKLSSAWIFCLLLAPLPAVADPPCAITSNFNGTPIHAGNYIWFTSVLKPSGLGSNPVTIHFTQQTITSANFTLSVPDATVTFVTSLGDDRGLPLGRIYGIGQIRCDYFSIRGN